MKRELLHLLKGFCRRRSPYSHTRHFGTHISPDPVNQDYSHTPVMVKEVIEALSPRDNGVYLDMTFGAGGHSKTILSKASIKLICLDRDPVAFDLAKQLADTSDGKVIPLLGKFSELEKLMGEAGVPKNSLDGILIDAGCSSMQLDDPSRGFSFIRDGPLDMRMDGTRDPDQPTAADVVNTLDPLDLGKIIKIYGEEKYAKKIARALFDFRYQLKAIKTTSELADLVATIINDKRSDGLQRPVHVATKVFQAIRIFVNNELNELNYGIELAHSYLKPGGKLVALTFHSLEDRIVKRHILGIDMDEALNQTLSQKYKNAISWHNKQDMDELYTHKWVPLYKSVVTPTEDEVRSNSRSRSAKLRAAIKQ